MEGSFWKGFTNPYERKARLYPAFLVMGPALGVAACIYGAELTLTGGLVSFAISFGGLYLLANVARELGKRKEQALYVAWGGKPSTQVQRHSHPHFDPVTKSRFHTYLSKKLQIPFPSAADEEGDAVGADGKYAAATLWLIEHTRDRARFPILFAENVGYGYRRNALGLKPLGLGISLAAIIWALGAGGLVTGRVGISELPPTHAASLLLSAAFMAMWLFYFTAATVKTAAFSYADALLRTSIVLEKEG
jgi:hypothetical protein